MWHSSDGSLVNLLRHPWSVGALAFSRTGKYLATVDDAGSRRVWDPAKTQALATTNWVGVPDAAIGPLRSTAIAIDSSEKFVACFPDDGFVHVWNWTCFHGDSAFPMSGSCYHLAFAANGSIATVRGQISWQGADLSKRICQRLQRLGIDSLFVGGGCSANN